MRPPVCPLLLQTPVCNMQSGVCEACNRLFADFPKLAMTRAQTHSVQAICRKPG
jgi:hypothetical protein